MQCVTQNTMIVLCNHPKRQFQELKILIKITYKYLSVELKIVPLELTSSFPTNLFFHTYLKGKDGQS